MAWQLLAIWAIVTLAVIWFLRDEKRRRSDAALQRAARYYAHAPKYRHVSANPVPMPETVLPRRSGGLTQEQRAFITALMAPQSRAPHSD